MQKQQIIYNKMNINQLSRFAVLKEVVIHDKGGEIVW